MVDERGHLDIRKQETGAGDEGIGHMKRLSHDIIYYYCCCLLLVLCLILNTLCFIFYVQLRLYVRYLITMY